MNILNNIQILRAFAAINVIVYHLLGYTFTNTEQKGVLFNFMYEWGQNGVDLFFVISGFIMFYVQYHKKRKFTEFINDRIVRIVPSYWFLTLALSAMAFFFSAYLSTIVFDVKHIAASLFFVSQPLMHKFPLLYVGWTLEYEMLFYLLFAVSLLFKNLRNSVIFNISVIVLLSVLFNLTIMLEFLFGIIIGLIYVKYDLKKFGWLFFAVGTAAFLSTLLLDVNSYLTQRYLYWGIPSFLIVLGVINIPQSKNKLLTDLGNASYSIYLLHAPLIPLLFRVFKMAGVYKFKNVYWNDFLSVAVIGIILIIAMIYYKIFEKRITKFLKKFI